MCECECVCGAESLTRSVSFVEGSCAFNNKNSHFSVIYRLAPDYGGARVADCVLGRALKCCVLL